MISSAHKLRNTTPPRYLSIVTLLMTAAISSCSPGNSGKSSERPTDVAVDSSLTYQAYSPQSTDQVISRAAYADKLYGFWLGECIANWTGLVTEMDKIGGDGKDGRAAGFYTRENWGGPDEPAMWEDSFNNTISPIITYIFEDEGGVWGADDDTDIEYIYQYITYQNQTTQLSPTEIREGWLTHIYSEENTPFVQKNGVTKENFLWVSNQTAHNLMLQGMAPPETSLPANNPDYEMIDAQLTTEIFGLFAPTRPEVALEIAHLPIQTTARYNAEWISEFYVIMYSLASAVDTTKSMAANTKWMATEARKRLPNDSYSAAMYDFVKRSYEAGLPWEATRDSLHIKYQINQENGYDWYTRDQVCNGCFAAGINFGASLVSLFYGEGDIKETIKIGALAGWDSDNPTATWGGMLGFMLGKEGVDKAFGRKFASKFNIHRTRGGFPNNGIDTFDNMAKTGVFIVDRMVQERLGGGVDLEKNVWYIPNKEIKIKTVTP
jgi:hypothetical protein